VGKLLNFETIGVLVGLSVLIGLVFVL
jgi:hypothetical protein